MVQREGTVGEFFGGVGNQQNVSHAKQFPFYCKIAEKLDGIIFFSEQGQGVGRAGIPHLPEGDFTAVRIKSGCVLKLSNWLRSGSPPRISRIDSN